MVLAFPEKRASRDCDCGSGELSTGKPGTGGFSTSWSGRGVLIPKMDIEERNMALWVLVEFARTGWDLGCLFACGFPYIKRVSLFERVYCVCGKIGPMVNEWSCYWPCKCTLVEGNGGRGERREMKDDWSPPEVIESLACLSVQPLDVP